MTSVSGSNVFLRDDLRSGLLAIIVTQRAGARYAGSSPDYDAGFTTALAAVVALVGLADDVAIGRALGRGNFADNR